jgi:recombinational DNA repair protein RecR
MAEHGLAREQLGGALHIYINNLGEDHPSTKDVENILQQVSRFTWCIICSASTHRKLCHLCNNIAKRRLNADLQCWLKCV